MKKPKPPKRIVLFVCSECTSRWGNRQTAKSCAIRDLRRKRTENLRLYIQQILTDEVLELIQGKSRSLKQQTWFTLELKKLIVPFLMKAKGQVRLGLAW